MTANFQDYRDLAIAAVDDVMSEAVRHYPLANGLADDSRQRADLQAVLRVGSEHSSDIAGRDGASWSQRIAAGKAEAHISRVAFPELRIREGDRLRAMDRVGQPWFDVLSGNDHRHGRLVVNLAVR